MVVMVYGYLSRRNPEKIYVVMKARNPRNKLKIVIVGAPVSPVTSGLAYRSHDPLHCKLSENYNVIRFIPKVKNVAKLPTARSVSYTHLTLPTTERV